MILADKIIRLRKKNGWSQEELAAKMNVSRQAVSKWEGAQTIPDLDKILQLADLFGVTTDYLLKDEIEDEVFTKDVPNNGIKRVSIEEANEYLEYRKLASWIISVAVFLCIISPITLIILATASEENILTISENMAGGIGLVVLIVLVTVAVAMFVYCGFKTSPYEYLDKEEPFELEYGVSGMVKEKQKEFRGKYILYNIIATCVCVISPIPLIIGCFTEKEFICIVLLCITIMIAGLGACLFTFNGIRWASMQKLLKEGEYSLRGKKKSGLKETIGLVYWLILVAIYLIWSFTTNAWDKTWLIFAVGGILFIALMTVCELIINQKDHEQ